MGKAAATFADVLRPYLEGAVEWNRTQILDDHARRGSCGVEETVQLGHGLVEDGGDHAAVTVSGRASVAFAQPKAADELFAGFIEPKFQAHARSIVASAAEAEVLFTMWARAGAMADAVIFGCFHLER